LSCFPFPAPIYWEEYESVILENTVNLLNYLEANQRPKLSTITEKIGEEFAPVPYLKYFDYSKE
jgi:hypothetical protein